MTLSILKLKELFIKKNFKIVRYFSYHNVCMFIELVSKINGEMCMIYIQSEYEFRLAPDNERVFNITYYEIEEDQEKDITERYPPIEFEKKEALPLTMNDTLTDQYKVSINLKSKACRIQMIRSLDAHLNRIKLCLSDTRYKYMVTTNHFMSCLQRDERIDNFYIPGFVYPSKKQLYIVSDLKWCIENINTMHTDMANVRKGIYKILEKNVRLNIRHYEKIISEAPKQLEKFRIKYKELNQYKQMINKFMNILPIIDDKIKSIEQSYKSIGQTVNKSFTNDLNKSHQKHKLEKQLKYEMQRKQNVIENIEKLHQIVDHVSITLDISLYTNIVNFDIINTNLI